MNQANRHTYACIGSDRHEIKCLGAGYGCAK